MFLHKKNFNESHCVLLLWYSRNIGLLHSSMHIVFICIENEKKKLDSNNLKATGCKILPSSGQILGCSIHSLTLHLPRELQ